MNTQALNLAIETLQPHVLAIALIGARLIPVAFLCPLFGGSHAPTHVKLGVVLALALFLHGAGGIAAPAGVTSAFDLAALCAQELLFGTSLGLVAALPFDAARMGGPLHRSLPRLLGRSRAPDGRHRRKRRPATRSTTCCWRWAPRGCCCP